MPVHDGSRSDQDERLSPPGPGHSQRNPEQFVQGSQSTARSLRVQCQQLPTESQVFEDEVRPATERTDQPAEEMPERHDHGKNSRGKDRIKLYAKSLISKVYDLLARHTLNWQVWQAGFPLLFSQQFDGEKPHKITRVACACKDDKVIFENPLIYSAGLFGVPGMNWDSRVWGRYVPRSGWAEQKTSRDNCGKTAIHHTCQPEFRRAINCSPALRRHGQNREAKRVRRSLPVSRPLAS